MRLVLVTQVLDRRDAILGFVARWVEGLAARCERVRVVALEVGDTSGLPDNVDWRVLGRHGTLSRWLRYRRLLAEAFRDGFDTVLAHMVPRYALHAAAPARRADARLFLWYTSKGVDRRLERAVRVVDRTFTASEESLRVDAPTRVVTGHGIDVRAFDVDGAEPAEPPRLLSVGRLTPAKDPLLLVDALARLVARGRDVELDWAGGTLAPGDDSFSESVRERVRVEGLEDRVRFRGHVPHPEMPPLYRAATLVVSPSRTGSVDKALLEGMASGRPVLSSNDSYPALVAELGEDGEALVFPAGDADALAASVERWLDAGRAARDAVGARLRAVVERDHEVDALMARLVREMEAAR